MVIDERKIFIGKQKYSYEYVKNEFSKRNYELLTKEEEYKTVTQKLDYICNKHKNKGVLQISFSKLMNNRGCYYCGVEKTARAKMTILDYNEARELCEKHNFEFVDIAREDGLIYIKFICNKHREFGIQKMRKGNIKRNIKGCKYCNGNLPVEIINEKIKQKYPEYDILTDIKNLVSPIECYCKVHNHKWETNPQSLLKGCGCYYCGIEKLSKFHLHTQKEFEDLIKISNPDVEIISEYKGFENTVFVRCKKCGYEWEVNAASLKTNGTRCKKCSYTYKGEDKIIDVLRKLNIDYIHQYKFDDCRDQRPLPFDFYLPKYNCCIEFDGLQHYEPRFGKENFNITKLHDKMKNDYCSLYGISLLRIPYWESNNIESIIKNKIINQ